MYYEEALQFSKARIAIPESARYGQDVRLVSDRHVAAD